LVSTNNGHGRVRWKGADSGECLPANFPLNKSSELNILTGLLSKVIPHILMLTVENVSYRYPANAEDTLKDLNFFIAPGEIFGFLGPSGAGKSTTQKILYRLLIGYRGNIVFKDKPLDRWKRDFYEQIGVSFELPNHYLKLSGEENLKFFSSFFSNPVRDVRALLEKVGLEKDADKPVGEYSKGMKMRLNFVRALLHDPAMLFLDEPTAGLDPIHAQQIKTVIKELQAAGKTIFLTTHNMYDADQLCNRVAMLHGGHIRAIDTPENLKLKYGSKAVKITNRDKKEFIFVMDSLSQNKTFQKMLKDKEIETIHSQEATLEQAFIKITGQVLG